MNDSMKTIAVLCTIGLVIGLASAEAVSIWSNVVTVTVTNPPTTWPGTVTLSTDKATYDTSQQVKLTATLHDPIPTVQQVVTFYFSRMQGANANTPIGTDPYSSFILLNGTPVASSVTTTNGVAQLTCSVGEPGTYSFRAVVSNPT